MCHKSAERKQNKTQFNCVNNIYILVLCNIKISICNLKFRNCVQISQFSGGSRISRKGGVHPLGGRGPPMWVLFGENICENERIGSHRGRVPGTSPQIRQCSYSKSQFLNLGLLQSCVLLLNFLDFVK